MESEAVICERVARVDAEIRDIEAEIQALRSTLVESSVANADGLALMAMEVRQLADLFAEVEQLVIDLDAQGLAELPFVTRSLNGLTPGGRVLVTGTCGALASALARMGYAVTLLPSPETPSSAVTSSSGGDPSSQFDAAVCLATRESIGDGNSEDRNLLGVDRARLERVRSLLAPGGRLVLTLPSGGQFSAPNERAYEPIQLDELLGNWSDVQTEVVASTSAAVGSSGPSSTALVLVTASVPSQ